MPAFPSASSRAFERSGKISRIEAELNLELQSARDLHSIIKHSGVLNFSVGFRLEDFDVVEEKKLTDEMRAYFREAQRRLRAKAKAEAVSPA